MQIPQCIPPTLHNYEKNAVLTELYHVIHENQYLCVIEDVSLKIEVYYDLELLQCNSDIKWEFS